VLCKDGVYRTNQEITDYLQENNADYMDDDYELLRKMKSGAEKT
jgi:hypothetical protein